jgi:SAM-dependent methyltransferase
VIPWQVKILGKLVLSRLPLGYAVWKRLRLFEHGHMDQPKYAYEVFLNHYKKVESVIERRHFVALELGPGDTLFSGLIAHALGAQSCYLVDAGPFANLNPARYQCMATMLASEGLDVPLPRSGSSISEYLNTLGVRYLTNGIESLKSIPSQSVDFIWSQAVLEHVRLSDFVETLKELRRIIKGDGAMSHRIDLMDHLGGKLNNLRFSRKIWESRFMAISGFYTNRIRFSEMTRLFEEAGFSVRVLNTDRWSEMPTPKPKLAREFRHLDNIELLIQGFDVVLLPSV